MVTQRKPKASKYLTTPTRPVQVDRDRSVAGLLEKMEGAGFGGRQLAEAHRIWLDMLGDNTTIIVAGSGALIPAGMRRLLAYVIKNRFVDVLVLSGIYGYSHGETAQMLGVAEGTCKAQLHRARKLLQERLNMELN